MGGIGGLLILFGPPFFAIVNHGIQLNLVFGPMFWVGLVYLGCGWRRAIISADQNSPNGKPPCP